MHWVILTLISAILVSFVILIEKYVIIHDLKDPVIMAGVLGPGFFLVYTIYTLIFGTFIISLSAMIFAFFVGVFHVLALFFYYKSIKKEEVSRIIPLFSITGIFILIFAFFFFGETFSLIQYLGIFAIIIGSFLLSIKNFSDLRLSIAFLFAIISSFLLAMRAIFVKFASNLIPITGIFFWVGLGVLTTSLILFITHYHKFSKKEFEGIEILFFTSLLAALGILSFFSAISLAPVTLVSTLFQTYVFFTFIGATILTLVYPKFIREKLSKKIFIQKLIAIILIFIGSYFIL
ncbi:EamA family transporter [archaeon]|jgi:drug/metabolite transporter (DMT)-like permease|nr:EamA family transporter [archaeon]MBT3731400.1 EamA family transporter [archaeon]MBT4670297.1 EamA family transporter [archaeon]MBT7052445.1 EamA family transporter [archaeon]MBT7281385.1 EamA family transporter [archaeon]